MYINHNGMASNVANTLTSHYGNLATSTERLSSGLRVNSAADDAAGLAIRELMRADIAALNQGVRNANDAISLIQTADGALGIIDEKLIRMKELAEQAATGTYDSTQRLMIESEYQAMASEITRIANATDFNGMKLLNGDLEGTHDGSGLESTGKMKIHFGTANDSAEDYYYIEVKEMTAQALGVGNASGWDDVQKRGMKEIKNNLTDAIKANDNLTDDQKGMLLSQVETAVNNIDTAVSNAVKPGNAYNYWSVGNDDTTSWDEGFLEAAKKEAAVQGNSTVMEDFLATGARVEGLAAALKSTVDSALDAAGVDLTDTTTDQADKIQAAMKKAGEQMLQQLKASGLVTDSSTFDASAATAGTKPITTLVSANPDYDTIVDDLQTAVDDLMDAGFTAAQKGGTMKTAVDTFKEAVRKDADNGALKDDNIKAALPTLLSDHYDKLTDGDQQKLNYAFGKAAMYNLANVDISDTTGEQETDIADAADFAKYGIEAKSYNFGLGDGFTATDFGKDGTTKVTDIAAGLLSDALKAGYAKVADKDVAGYTIATQEDAQHALVALDNAITEKDKTRAHLGALQNRFENTVSNLTVQSENLQAAESRISDVDVATEMTNFVRNQILTQSAVAMLSQANSMPQMAMQLIG